MRPADWSVISNTTGKTSAQNVWEFPETLPLPTYLVAFAAGPFQKITQAGEPTSIFANRNWTRSTSSRVAGYYGKRNGISL